VGWEGRGKVGRGGEGRGGEQGRKGRGRSSIPPMLETFDATVYLSSSEAAFSRKRYGKTVLT